MRIAVGHIGRSLPDAAAQQLHEDIRTRQVPGCGFLKRSWIPWIPTIREHMQAGLLQVSLDLAVHVIEVVGGFGDENRGPFAGSYRLRVTLYRIPKGLEMLGQFRREVVQPVEVPPIAPVRTGSAENVRGGPQVV